MRPHRQRSTRTERADAENRHDCGRGHGLAFDDISYSTALERTVIPSASTGAISLIDPSSFSIETVPVFPPAPAPREG